MTDPNRQNDDPVNPAQASEPVVSKPYVMPDDPEEGSAEALAKEDWTFKFQRSLMPGWTCEATVSDAYGYTSAAICVRNVSWKPTAGACFPGLMRPCPFCGGRDPLNGLHCSIGDGKWKIP